MYHDQTAKGSYILLITLPETQTLRIGSRRVIHFQRGYYAYVGSAMGGFNPRLSRHLKENKNNHWHIDYLLQKASISGIIICTTGDRLECTIARALSARFSAVPGFGSSDCRCPSHLFFATGKRQMKAAITVELNRLGTKPEAVIIQERRD
ncbi:DUF123 domain-containing protein [Chloroflexota bacterium]